jgi:hypothetical protein
MSQYQILTILIICFSIILIASIIKFIYWLNAKRKGSSPSPFLFYYFKWYSVYALWDTVDDTKRQFMKVSNTTNRFIWFGAIVGAVFLYILLQQ